MACVCFVAALYTAASERHVSLIGRHAAVFVESRTRWQTTSMVFINGSLHGARLR